MPVSRFIQYKNKSIHYRVYGKGRPVILLHGLPADNRIWNDIAIELQNEFLIITPDLPGSGESEMLDGENISIEDYADVIKAIVDFELSEVLSLGEPARAGTNGDLGEVSLIGHSMGGYITLAFAEKYPELLNGFGLFHSTAYADDAEKKQTRGKAIDFIKANGAYPFLKTSTPNLFADRGHLKEMEDMVEEGKKFNASALIQYYYAMINRPDRTAVIKDFRNPVLFIIGERDSVVPLQASLQQCYLPEISHVHILDTGHMGMIEVRERSLQALKSFLKNLTFRYHFK